MPSIPVSRKELPESEPTAFGAARDGPRDVGQGQHSIHERETRIGGASGNGAAADGSAADSGPAAVAGLDEFRVPGRVDLGGHPPRPPTDPDLRGIIPPLSHAPTAHGDRGDLVVNTRVTE